MIRSTTQRATALLLVLGMLALLAALAVAFARSSIDERRAAQGHADHLRARLLAEAGVQHAIGHLRGATARQRWDSPADDWVCGDAPDTALDDLRRPSLIGGVAHGRAYSGLLGSDLVAPGSAKRVERGGSYLRNGDQYVVRITDLATRLDLRHPDAAGQGNVRLLASLCRLLDVELPRVALVAPSGFASVDDLLAGFSAGDRERLAPYLTVHGWRDRTAVRPVPGRRVGQAALLAETHGRAPLNLNLAPRILLEAALAGIAATYLDPASGAVRSVEITPRKAEQLSLLIEQRREKSAFHDHADLERFLATLVGRTLTLAEASLVAVHANPDAQLLKFNPDRALFGTERLPRLFDRSDLTRFSTEFTFRRTGVFRIESLGRLLAPGGGVAARSAVRTVVRLQTQTRVTSQRDHLTHSTLRDGVTLYPESHGASKLAGALAGRIALAGPSLPGLAFFRPGSFEPIAGDTPRPGGTARTVSVFDEGNRFADGYHASRPQQRVLHYPGRHLPAGAGSVSFWWKPDDQAFRETGGLFFADTPTGKQRGLSTAVYYQRGMLYATRTGYRAYGGRPGQFLYTSRTPVIVTGKLRPDAGDRLLEIGSNWLRTHKPGHGYWHYQLYGESFRDLVLDGVSKGKQMDVLYIYDVERKYGLGHVGCITHYIYMHDYYDYIYQTGYEVKQQEVNTLAYLDVVDESGNQQFNGLRSLDTPFAASRVEKGVSIDALEPHRWYHVRLSWTDGTDVRLFVDGVESRDHERYFGPLNPWSSRLVEPADRFFSGPFELDRASDEAGEMTPQWQGRHLFVGTHGTFSGLSIERTPATGSPAPRYRESGVYQARVEAGKSHVLIGAQLAQTTPAGTTLRFELQSGALWKAVDLEARDWPRELELADPHVAYRITMTADREFPGKLTPFADSLTLTWLHAPVILSWESDAEGSRR